MNHLVIVCPVCGDSIIVTVGRGCTSNLGFNSRCGTQITVLVDTRNETETARIAKLKARSRSESTIK